MEQEIDLLELLKILLGKLWILLICMVVGGLVGFTVSKVVMHRQYESNTTMYVMNYNVAYPDQNGAGNDIDLGDLNTSKTLASTYITVLKSNAVMEEVGRQLTQKMKASEIGEVFTVENGKISNTAIRNSMTMATVDDTEVIKITARTENPQVSAELCNILADVAPDFLLSVVKAGSVEIIDVAVPNDVPVSPNIPRNTLLGLLLGLILSAGVIILLSFLDDTVKEKEEISRKFEKPTLGEVQRMSSDKSRDGKTIFGKKLPQLRKKKKSEAEKEKDDRRRLLTDPKIPFNVVESYKTLRTNIFFALGTSGKRVFAVSSVNPSEGKSTTAANIAIAFAQTGSKVLLIDADMRKPVQHKTFRVKNKTGLSTLIVQMSGASESVKETSVPGLDLLPSGPIPPNPSELLASEQFRDMLKFFESSYDYVIIDTPPISVVTDAMVMKDGIAGILLVLRYGSTKEADIADTLRRFEFSEANMLGFVLNDIQKKGGIGYYRRKKDGYGGYDSYGYGYGYGYGRGEAEMKEYIPTAHTPTTEPAEEPVQTADLHNRPEIKSTVQPQAESRSNIRAVEKETVSQSEENRDDRLSLSHTAADRRRVKKRRHVAGNDPHHEEPGSPEDRSDTTLLRPQRTRHRTFSDQAPGSISEDRVSGSGE